MEDKIAVVTGAGTGIGTSICRALSHQGFKVGVHYNSSEASAKALVDSLKNAFLIQADLSEPSGADAIYDIIKDEHGKRIDVLVNNAGATNDNPIFSASLDDFNKVVNINMRNTWYLTKRISRLMIRRKAGRIINISSVVGSTGNATQSIYGMTKAAIDNFTKTAAVEFAEYGILVNSIAPGFIETDMTKELAPEIKENILSQVPLRRMGKPEEIAEMVVFLATSGSYCTGSVFHVNGGMYGG